MQDHLFPRDNLIELDLSNPCLGHEFKHIEALLNPSARRVLEQNNFSKLYYFYMHACIRGYYQDRFFNHWRSVLGDKDLHGSEALLLDCSLEGDYQVDEIVDRVCTELGAQRYQVIVVSQSGGMGVPQVSVFYNQAHYDIVSDRSRRLIDASLQGKADSMKDFVCLNNMPRPHRIALVAYLYSKALHMSNYISYTDNAYGRGGQSRSYSLEHYAMTAKNQCSSIENQINYFLTDLPSSGLVIPESQDGSEDIASSAGTPWNIYSNSRFSIVTESDFTTGLSNRNARVTEKVYKSIAVGHPFILVGNAGSLMHLKDLGFSTFTPFIDEDYDNPESLDIRMLKVCRSIDLLLSDLVVSVELCEDLVDIASFNRRHLMSGALQGKLEDLYNASLCQYLSFWRQ
jgi:hypothetical protein